MTFSVGVNAMEWAEIFDWIIRLLPILIPLAAVQFILMITSVVSLVRKPNPMNEMEKKERYSVPMWSF